MTEERQGWHPDPFGRHEARYFSAGSPTYLVRDGYVEGSDPVGELPRQDYPRPADTGMARASYAPPPVMRARVAPSPWSVPVDAVLPSGHHGLPGHSGRVAVLAAIGVVLVVGVVILAVAITRHPPRSTTSLSAVTTPTAASSPAVAVNSAAVVAASPAVAGGFVVQSTSGHFAARFPSIPIQQTVEETVAGVRASVNAAVVRSPLTEVVEEDLSSAVPTSREADVLRAAIAVAAAISSDGSTAQQSDTSFRGTAARTATFAMPTGEEVTVLTFFQGPRTVYFLLADAGAPFQALSASLQFGPTSSPQVLS